MRVYKFLSKEFGLKALKERRLKITRQSDLNDPFELLAFDVSDPALRELLEESIHQLLHQKKRGLVCFSRRATNPVIWAHYADKHQGVCLGFDLRDDIAHPVKYTHERVPYKSHEFVYDNIKEFLYTKFADWQYEAEARTFASTEEEDDRGMSFVDFSDALVLREVIVGVLSPLTKGELDIALKSYSDVSVFKAARSHSSFDIIIDQPFPNAS